MSVLTFSVNPNIPDLLRRMGTSDTTAALRHAPSYYSVALLNLVDDSNLDIESFEAYTTTMDRNTRMNKTKQRERPIGGIEDIERLKVTQTSLAEKYREQELPFLVVEGSADDILFSDSDTTLVRWFRFADDMYIEAGVNIVKRLRLYFELEATNIQSGLVNGSPEYMRLYRTVQAKKHEYMNGDFGIQTLAEMYGQVDLLRLVMSYSDIALQCSDIELYDRYWNYESIS